MTPTSSRRTTRLALALAVALGPLAALSRPGGAWAQPTQAPATPAALSISLSDAMARAEQTYPALAPAQALVGEAEATRVGAGIRLPVNPRLQFDVRPALEGGARGDRPGWAASADATFEVGGAAGARLREADGRVATARAELATTRLEARTAALATYVEAKLAEQRRARAKESVDLAERLAAAARERQAAGAGHDIETTSAEIALAESRATFLDAEAAEVRATRELRFLLALPPDRPLVLATAVTEPGTAPDAGALVARALAEQPALEVIRRRLALHAATEERLRKEALPKVGIFGGIDASPESPRFAIAGLSIDLPVAQRNQGPRAAAAAARRTEEARLDVERRALEHAVRTLRSVLETRRAEAELLGARGIPAARRRLELVEAGWKAGRFDVLRVTAAHQDLVRLQEKWIDVLARLWSERIALERLVGGWPTDKS